MRGIETLWGVLPPHEVVPKFLCLSQELPKVEEVMFRSLLLELWQVSPKYGEIAAYTILRRRAPKAIIGLAQEIMLRGPVVTKLVQDVAGACHLRNVLVEAQSGDEITFKLRESEQGLQAMTELWSLVDGSLSVVSAVTAELVEKIVSVGYVPGLRIPYTFSVLPVLLLQAEWLAVEIYKGVEWVGLVRRATPYREERKTEH